MFRRRKHTQDDTFRDNHQIFISIKDKNLNALKEALNNPEYNQIFVGKSGQTGKMQDGTIVELINTKDEKFITKALPLLLNSGANINSQQDGWNALNSSVENNLLKTTSLLLHLNIIPITHIEQIHPIRLALLNNNIEITKLLINNDLQIHYNKTYEQELILLWLSEIRRTPSHDRTHLITYLLDEYLPINSIENKKNIEDAILLFILRHDSDALKVLDTKLKYSPIKEFNHLIAEAMQLNHKFLQEIISHCSTEFIEYILNVNKEVVNAINLTWVMDISNSERRLQIAQLLLKNGCDINSVGKENSSTLIKASYKGYADLVELLLSHGADMTIRQSAYGNDALNMALYYKHPEVVKLLLKNYPDINQQSDVGLTPLMTAIQTGDIELVKLVLEKNPDITVLNTKNGKDAFYYADGDILKLLNSQKKLNSVRLTKEKTKVRTHKKKV